ncbi:hypothetical protein [Ureaplasma ceti]|uniref:Transmembrane protein n=1 Tax=Ureaplasma ceti TaxID=3119530 RepID=A0ABP9U9F2_9BACT
MDNFQNNPTWNNYYNPETTNFRNHLKKVIKLSASLIILNIVWIVILIINCVWNVEQKSNGQIDYATQQTLITWICMLITKLALSIGNAVYSSKVNDYLNKWQCVDQTSGKVIFICSIVAIFIVPITLNAVILGFACNLNSKWNNGTLGFKLNPGTPPGFNPYSGGNGGPNTHDSDYLSQPHDFKNE